MKKLTKSATDRQVSGVLGGISEYFGIDSTIVRVVFLISVFAGVGSPVLLYILMAVLMPEPGRNDSGQSFGGTYGSSSSRRGTDTSRSVKEAKPVEKQEEDDWSDF
ncbi:phage shock protein C (PspC) family protein [Trichococcus patagoniensis]|uniref:Phage shock protein C (PspC) family protein n=1 Tax=Trichococcus patagoniensis TaxID=382641 RepID=A0A2T5IMG1_9LACT|nr:PspC domain-containing protein [Trichococcus patagoniensis]PTQ85011.1 phage shock protein C (PspC) family protein [Trichococcus patagoniensis]